MTDKIQIMKVSGRTATSVVGLADCGVVQRICAPVLEATDFEPPRLRVKAFPTPDMIAELASIAPLSPSV